MHPREIQILLSSQTVRQGAKKCPQVGQAGEVHPREIHTLRSSQTVYNTGMGGGIVGKLFNESKEVANPAFY